MGRMSDLDIERQENQTEEERLHEEDMDHKQMLSELQVEAYNKGFKDGLKTARHEYKEISDYNISKYEESLDKMIKSKEKPKK
ncbi:MAG: hypothetical protein Tp1124SUR272871_26 [Prokaryotic dsDNA virus sp.]|nr:MAG: hypothetical protein Tp1125SUR00d2C35834131_12 [Prokaryotic dsDNA virus sp.]QDP67346.1 MAG: hypothetical protein Tp1124SUR272871_26 [Prokaryotic dsDNA virus sp.]|tara:strand:+ start:30 stop:278 length:249 start_codon:yes stop_codon:yes gene_type:complete